jgi:hypothetical protein
LDLYADRPEASGIVWRSAESADEARALVLISKSGRMPVDAVEVLSGSGPLSRFISR